MNEEVPVINGRLPLKHWIIQGIISLTLGGIVSATAAVVSIRWQMKLDHIETLAIIDKHYTETKSKFKENERINEQQNKRLDKHDDILNTAFPRHIQRQ